MSTVPIIPVWPAEPTATEFAESFHKVEAELRALESEQLVALNVDPAAAVALVRGALRRVGPFATRIAACPETDHGAIAKLPRYADALWFTHSRCLGTVASPSELPELEAQCAKHFKRLGHVIALLVDEGEVAEGTVNSVGPSPSYRDTAMAVSALVEVVRGVPVKKGLAPHIHRDELDEIALGAARLLDAVATRDAADVAVRDAATLRARAFTRFAYAYDELRRAMSYLRWREDDVSDFVPALTGGRSAKAHKDAPAEPAPSSEPAPAPAKPAGNGQLDLAAIARAVPKPFGP